MSKKHCMFQYGHAEWGVFGGANGWTMVEDTGLITWEKALGLWNKYKSEFIRKLDEGLNPEMCIWTGCKDTTDYHADAFHVNSNTEVERGQFIERTVNIIDPNKVTMGEPV